MRTMIIVVFFIILVEIGLIFPLIISNGLPEFLNNQIVGYSLIAFNLMFLILLIYGVFE